MSKRPQPPADIDPVAELSDEEIALARPASRAIGRDAAAALTRPQGRPAMPEGERKQPVSIRLSPDVLAAAKATGPGWQTRIDDALRTAFLLEPDALDAPKQSTAKTLFERMAYLARVASENGNVVAHSKGSSSKTQTTARSATTGRYMTSSGKRSGGKNGKKNA